MSASSKAAIVRAPPSTFLGMSPLKDQEYMGGGVPLASHGIVTELPINPASFGGGAVMMDGASAGEKVRENTGI